MTVIQRKVPLLDLQAQHQQIRDEVLAEIVRVVDSQKFILGEDVKKLEQEIAAYCDCSYAIGCASGSDALVLALMALDIGPGDEVLTTPYSFFATAGAISRVGAVPVFVDVEARYIQHRCRARWRTRWRHASQGSRDHSGASVRRLRGHGSAAGASPRERGIPVVEDAAQSIGSEYKGRRAGSIGADRLLQLLPEQESRRLRRRRHGDHQRCRRSPSG